VSCSPDGTAFSWSSPQATDRAFESGGDGSGSVFAMLRRTWTPPCGSPPTVRGRADPSSCASCGETPFGPLIGGNLGASCGASVPTVFSQLVDPFSSTGAFLYVQGYIMRWFPSFLLKRQPGTMWASH